MSFSSSGYDEWEEVPLDSNIPEDEAVEELMEMLDIGDFDGYELELITCKPTPYLAEGEVGNIIVMWNDLAEEIEEKLEEDEFCIEVFEAKIVRTETDDLYKVLLEINKDNGDLCLNLTRETFEVNGEEAKEILRAMFRTGYIYSCSGKPIYTH